MGAIAASDITNADTERTAQPPEITIPFLNGPGGGEEVMSSERESLKQQAPDWTDWIKSDEGKRCANVTSLVKIVTQKDREIYLENRLWAAFVAGAKYEREK
jgi:hypothetical protein